MDSGQVNRNAAEVYEAFFVPALFKEWATRVADAAAIRPRQRILDVACGTGILARAAADRVGGSGAVVGLDVNEGMLAVAARKAPHIDWRKGKAEALPFDDCHFDAVVSQFGLMFFEDRQSALREMFRVLQPGGHLAVAVWDSLDSSPGYSALAGLLKRLFGEEVAIRIRAPFSLGDVPILRTLFADADIPEVQITTLPGTACFPSMETWMRTEIKGWVLADVLDDRQFARLLEEAQRSLSAFVTPEGSVAFSALAHIASTVKS
jgi:SAM-dependent methyltransferase